MGGGVEGRELEGGGVDGEVESLKDVLLKSILFDFNDRFQSFAKVVKMSKSHNDNALIIAINFKIRHFK